MKHPFTLPAAALALALLTPAHGLTLRTYNASRHARFSSGFPGNPVMNPSFLHDATKFTGVGWWYIQGNPSASDTQLTLVSPRHVISVRHLENNFNGGNQLVRFVGSDGQVHTRTIAAFTNILDGSDKIDLAITQLSAPLPATVKPLRYCNNLSEVQLTGDALMVLGKNHVSGNSVSGGSSTIGPFANLPYDPYSDNTRVFSFDYLVAAGSADQCYYGPSYGDSSSPAFVDHNGEPALVGLAAVFVGNNPLVYQNFCTFVPAYITQLDAVLNPAGYRMRPVQYTPTTLSVSSVSSPASLRQAYGGSIAFTFSNSGAQATGSAGLTLAFDPAQAPASVTAPGWIVEAMGGGVWSIRKALMPASDSIVATATWTSMPAVATLGVTATAESDTATTVTSQPSFTLKPTYAAWSTGLSEPAEGDDPDDDGLANLLEYALGGNPGSGSMVLSGTQYLRPEISASGGTITLSYPERSDAVVRGLSYIVETSTALDSLAGATTLPAGAVSGTAAFSPDIPGFVKRTITWPSDGPQRFARVKVTLAETP
ncbi:hypothetical protein OKA04_04995 [Luteolibacter flavescens]|uniref:Uncharacterized protein n=1 Tax=Luteolibacter flavescens TaxID=1859460 RepID=A0ABT3FKK0_9BACT|nr:hypothetical protein [Luteolibacter flavescens]MCW1884075.1 hypothetical protein [Luteolibacter flavescens]